MASSMKVSKWQVIPVLVLGLIAATSTTYAAQLSVQLSQLKQNPEAQAQQEAVRLVETVGALIDLPTDETPTIATVSEPEKLKDQPFFAKAQAGDKVLIYANAKKAVLFNPTLNKVMDITQLTLDTTSTPTEDVTAVDSAASDAEVTTILGDE